ncbi:MAG: hypothetical protein F6K45_15515 [Kamptonema sp. SIO1D9]|nr:hypothetical protein [Kamptonema sp. SIO1D9]
MSKSTKLKLTAIASHSNSSSSFQFTKKNRKVVAFWRFAKISMEISTRLNKDGTAIEKLGIASSSGTQR